jgi:DNA-binding beta-propeller fold protein YncE
MLCRGKLQVQPDRYSGEKMKRRYSVLAASLALIAIPARAQDASLKLVQTITLPPDAKGQFDHFGVDLKGGRLFATPEASKSVRVFDLKSGKPLHTIGGLGKPHAVLYREDLDRIYVTDGDAGDLKIFDGKTYKLLSAVKLLEDADSIGYDPKTKYLYIDNGGGDVHETYSMLSIVDTTAGKKVADIKIDGETLEAMTLESSTPRLYVNNKAKNQVEVVDRDKRAIIATWPITKCKTNVAMALDETDHRLFIACRTSTMVVMDTQSGKEIAALPITKGVDDAVYDPSSKRIYTSADGGVDVYQQSGPDQYKLLAQVPTAPLARTARLVPELKRYFVAVPQHGTDPAKILVFEVL